MDLAKLKKKNIKRKFEYEGEKINYEIKGGFLTPSFIHVLSNLQQDANLKGLAEEMAKAIVSWDIDWNGEEFPPTFENLYNLDMDFVNALLEDMSAVFTVGEKKSAE